MRCLGREDVDRKEGRWMVDGRGMETKAGESENRPGENDARHVPGHDVGAVW